MRVKQILPLTCGVLLSAFSGLAQTAQGPSSPSPAPGTATGSAAPFGVASGPGGATTQSQNPFSGSVPVGTASSEVLPLSLKDAIERGMKQNLGLLLASDSVLTARGQRWRELSDLLPTLTTVTKETVAQTNLAAQGIKFPGISPIVGPFGYFDTRAFLKQSLFDWKAVNNTRAAGQSLRAAQYSYKDARDLVVLACGYAYLQAISGEARVDTADAQQKSAQALYNQAVDLKKAGVSVGIDLLRAQVELQTRQQQLIAAKNDFAKQKLAIARIIGLPPGQEFTLADKAPYEPLEAIPLEEALHRAYSSRADYQSALAQVRSSEFSRKAARAGYFPSVAVNADYGDLGVTPSHSHGTFDVSGAVTIPIFQGGRVHGDVLEADALLQQSRQQLENLRGQIDQDVRTALLDLSSASEQVASARSNVELAGQTLDQAKDRFSAGVTNNIEIVLAQESVASANESYISSLYAYNFAKIELARALGLAEEGVLQFWKGK